MPAPSLNPTSAYPYPVQGCRTKPLHAHTQFKAVESHLCMPTPSSRLSSECPHSVQGCQTLLHMPAPSSRQSNPTSACPHPVQGPPLNAHTQFKAVKPLLHMPTPSSRLSSPISACPHPQFKAVEPKPHPVEGLLFMHTPSSRQSNPTSACPHPTGCGNTDVELDCLELGVGMQRLGSTVLNWVWACRGGVQQP